MDVTGSGRSARTGKPRTGGNSSTKQAVRQIAVFAGLLIVILVICRLTLFRTYTVRIPLTEPMLEQAENGKIRAVLRQGEAAHLGPVRLRSGYLSVQVHPDQAGEADIDILDETGESIRFYTLRISPEQRYRCMRRG